MRESPAYVPKSMTSNAKAEGRFDKSDFIYIARDDEYQCPAGQRAIYRFTREEAGLQLRRYWSSACPRCPMKQQCTPSDYRRISRWEHEHVLEAVQRRLGQATECDDGTQANRRACLRNAEALDGFGALLDSPTAQRLDRNESSRAGLQPQARDEHPRHRQNDESDEIGGCMSIPLCTISGNHISRIRGRGITLCKSHCDLMTAEPTFQPLTSQCLALRVVLTQSQSVADFRHIKTHRPTRSSPARSRQSSLLQAFLHLLRQPISNVFEHRKQIFNL